MPILTFKNNLESFNLPIVKLNGKSAYEYALEGGYSEGETKFSQKMARAGVPFPIGAIYQSFNSVSPAELFGGDWEQIVDCFLFGGSFINQKASIYMGSYYPDTTTRGEAKVKLTIDQIPSHSHTIRATNSEGSGFAYDSHCVAGSRSWNLQTHDTGEDEAHNNMPPYIAVYTWRRMG